MITFDIWLFRAINFFHTPILNYIAIVLSSVTEYGIFWYVLLLVILCINRKKNLKIFIFGLATLAANLGIVRIVNQFWVRQRPYQALDSVVRLGTMWQNNSFPSGHVLSCFAVSTYLFFVYPKLGKWLLLMSFAVAWSRVYSGMHYPLDVFASFLLGILLGCVVYRIDKWYEQKYGRADNS